MNPPKEPSVLAQWEAEAATLKNSMMIIGDDAGEKHDAIYEDQKRILALIDLVRKITELKRKYSCPSYSLEEQAFSEGFNACLEEVIALTKELK